MKPEVQQTALIYKVKGRYTSKLIADTLEMHYDTFVELINPILQFEDGRRIEVKWRDDDKWQLTKSVIKPVGKKIEMNSDKPIVVESLKDIINLIN